jgi:hypothetical protein
MDDDEAPIEPVSCAPNGHESVDEAIFVALAGGKAPEGDDLWPARERRSGVRLSLPLLVLVGLIVAAGAFWGGAAAQRAQGTSPSSRAALSASRIAALFGRGASSSSAGAGLFGGASAPAASGTLTAVIGRTLYVTSTTGTIVKVELSPATTIELDAKVAAEALKSGDLVVIEGTTSHSGVVSAVSVIARAPGVGVSSSGFGGFGGGGGFGGAAGTGGSGG